MHLGMGCGMGVGAVWYRGVWVCLRVSAEGSCMPAKCLPRGCLPVGCLPGEVDISPDGYCHGWYASYWNAYLFQVSITLYFSSLGRGWKQTRLETEEEFNFIKQAIGFLYAYYHQSLFIRGVSHIRGQLTYLQYTIAATRYPSITVCLSLTNFI